MQENMNVDEVVVNGVTLVPKGSESGKLVPVQEGTVGLWEIGKQYFVRTVTYHVVGKLVHVSDNELLFEDASWVASSGRFNEALRTGTLSEVEPFTKPVLVGRSALIDATEWEHALPTDVK